ncbi:hypothetical protein EDD85DRAFT_1027741 [Armillaria nabsnona]|nr:hypothetical protein EDD85DRAFT_1027741 [Armillaria nabsnona]
MIPHFGEYITIKLDPVASLQSLNDEEVTKACSALETKTYVACATYLYSLPLPGVDWMPVVYTSDDLASVALPMNDPWDFIHEVKALKRIEEEYHERTKAKIQADIIRARQKDEDLHARLQSKLPNRGSSPKEEDMDSASEVPR